MSVSVDYCKLLWWATGGTGIFSIGMTTGMPLDSILTNPVDEILSVT